MKITFTVPGAPVGKGRPKFARRGNFVSTYTPEKTASYENLVKVKAEEAMQGNQIIDGPAYVQILLFVAPPNSWSMKKKQEAVDGKIFPTSKPDIDNVIKGIFDAMNEIVWRDDKQVVCLSVVKSFAPTPKAVIEVKTI